MNIVSYKYSENEGNPYPRKRAGAADGTLVKPRPQHRMDGAEACFYLEVKLHCVTEKVPKMLPSKLRCRDGVVKGFGIVG
jgi:hypothetical protein